MCRTLSYTGGRRTGTRSRTGGFLGSVSTSVRPTVRTAAPGSSPPAVRSPMPIDVAQALAAEPRSAGIAWGHKDVQLYHLGLGAGANPDKDSPATDPDELR